jgi:hypothetical protein
MVKHIIFSLTFLLSSCLKDDELSLIRKDNTSKKLKLTGYFYNEFTDNSNKVQIYFLYQNGIIMYGLTQDKNNLISFEEDFRSGKFYLDYAHNKYIWGIYEINAEVFKFERWYPSEKPHRTSIREGLIQNDSTFTIKKSYKADGSDLVERDELYKFKKLNPKPDSTNMFVK